MPALEPRANTPALGEKQQSFAESGAGRNDAADLAHVLYPHLDLGNIIRAQMGKGCGNRRQVKLISFAAPKTKTHLQ